MATDTFGDSTASGGQSDPNDRIVGSPGTPSSGGTGNYITIDVVSGWSAGEKIKCALYKTSDLSLVAETEELTTGGTGTFDFTFGSPPTIESGVEYAVLVWADNALRIVGESGGAANTYWYQVAAYGSWPDPIGSSSSSTKKKIYCTYTIAAAGTNTQMNVGDAWKSIAAYQVNIGDAWKDVASMKINIGDAWKDVFS